ncbi:MAG: AAA family ATPase [Nanoarchaeota archaeon]|nr:AAA family ATPase [Nanoarchaeota archaeon]
MVNHIDSITEFHSLLDYYISCLEKEEKLMLNFDYKENNKRFYSHIFKKELFLLQKKEQVEIKKTPETEGIFKDYKLNYKDVPISYGYPLFMDSNGKVSPVFYVEIRVDEKEGALIFTKMEPNPEFNHYILSKHEGYGIEEINNIRAKIAEEEDFSIKLSIIAKELNLDEKTISPELEQKPMIVTNSPQLINKAILYFGGKMGFTKGLIDELRELKKKSKHEIETTSLGFLFGKEKLNDKEKPKELLEAFNLNESQEEGVKEAFSNDISVITGPPGTGKSQVVLNIIANAVWNDKTVLFASKNNQAVNVVNDKLKGVLSKDLVIRMGSGNYRKKAKLQISNLFQHKESIKVSSSFEKNKQSIFHLNEEIHKLKSKIGCLSELNAKIDKHYEMIETLSDLLPKELKQDIQNKQYLSLNKFSVKKDISSIDILILNIKTLNEKIKEEKAKLNNFTAKIGIPSQLFPLFEEHEYDNTNELELIKDIELLCIKDNFIKKVIKKVFPKYFLNEVYSLFKKHYEALDRDVQAYFNKQIEFNSKSIKANLELILNFKRLSKINKEIEKLNKDVSKLIETKKGIFNKYYTQLSTPTKKFIGSKDKSDDNFLKQFLSWLLVMEDITTHDKEIHTIKNLLFDEPHFSMLYSKIAKFQEERQKISKNIFEDYWFEKLKNTSPSDENHVSRYIDATEKLEPYIQDPTLWYQLVKEQQREIEKVLPFLPVWIVTNLSAKNSLPLKENLFDLLVIDEASQCDIASAFPLFYRAKKVVVIGDTQQLKHISSLKDSEDNKIASDNKISKLYLDYAYSKNSLYDISKLTIQNKNKHPTLLNQHYRSHKDIINFSNEYFYDKRLDIMTDENKLISKGAYPMGIKWVDVKGNTKSLHNNEEAEKIISIIKKIRNHHKSDFKKVSLGVVTLFKNQMELITNRINKTKELEEMDIKVGTAHRFQGDEKDIIIFSPAISQNTEQKTLNWVHATKQLLNVAITRARSILIIVGDKERCQEAGGILKKLADYCIPREQKEVNFESKIEHRLYKRLEKDKIKFHYQYETKVKGNKLYRLDFALFVNKNKYDIEIDGDKAHSQKIESDSLRNTHLKLEGWKIRRFRAVDIQNNLGKVMEEIKRLC